MLTSIAHVTPRRSAGVDVLADLLHPLTRPAQLVRPADSPTFDALLAEHPAVVWPLPERSHEQFLRSQGFMAWEAWQHRRTLPVPSMMSVPVKKNSRRR